MSASVEKPTPDNAPPDHGSALIETGIDAPGAFPDDELLKHQPASPYPDSETPHEPGRAAEVAPPVGGHPEHTLGAPRVRQYEQHELSALFPRMDGDGFARLVESIRTQGLLEPITLADGKILDGYHRDEACYAAGVKPDYVQLPASHNKVDFVIGKNFERRQLTASQTGMLVARIAELQRGGSRSGAGRKKSVDDDEKNQRTKLPFDSFADSTLPNSESGDALTQVGIEETTGSGDIQDAGVSIAAAARLGGVSRSTVVVAKRLLSAGNDNLLEAVMQHGMSNGHALSLAKLPVDDQIQAISDFVAGKKEGEKRKTGKADAKKAVEKSKKENAGIDVTCVVPGESNLSTVFRIINGLDWAISYFKLEVPNEEMQNRYEKLLARARALIDNDSNVKKILIVN